MRKLIYILLLFFLPLSLGAAYFFVDKKDFIRTPNSNNIIVDWNLKSYTYNAPHGVTPSLRGAPDSTGYIFVKDTVGEKRLYFYVRGSGWLPVANNFMGISDSLSKKANKTFDNVANGAIPVAKLAANTISGVQLGGILANLSVDASLTGTAYNGSAARTFGLNTANANTFSATQTYSTPTTPVIYNSAASAAYSNLYRQNGVNRFGIGLTAAGNMATFYYPDGVTPTSAYSTNFNTGITTYQVAPTVPTQAANDNSTKAASTAYVDNASSTASRVLPYRAITAATTITATDYTIHVTAGSFNQPLPNTLSTGQILNVKNTGSGLITITATSIDGQTNQPIPQGSSLTLQYTGTTGTYIIL